MGIIRPLRDSSGQGLIAAFGELPLDAHARTRCAPPSHAVDRKDRHRPGRALGHERCRDKSHISAPAAAKQVRTEPKPEQCPQPPLHGTAQSPQGPIHSRENCLERATHLRALWCSTAFTELNPPEAHAMYRSQTGLPATHSRLLWVSLNPSSSPSAALGTALAELRARAPAL